jgi:hypothetical protein
MFVTYPECKDAWQFDGRSTSWHSIELFLQGAFFLGSFSDSSEHLVRTVFMTRTVDLLTTAIPGLNGQLIALSIVLPPAAWGTNWSVVRVKTILAARAARTDYPRLVFAAVDRSS